MDELGIEPPPPDDQAATWIDTALYWLLGCLVAAFAFSRSGCDPVARARALMATALAVERPAPRLSGALDDKSGRGSAYAVMYNRAHDMASAQRWSEALPLADQACRLDSRGLPPEARAAAYLLRGEILGELRRYDEAIATIEQARALGTIPRLHEVLAGVYWAKQDYRQVVGAARDYTDAGGPPSVNVYVLAAMALDKLGDVAEAAQWTARGRTDFPGDPTLAKLAERFNRQAWSERGMSTREDGRFVLKFVDLAEQSDVREKALRALNRAYNSACATYAFTPRGALPVILYPTTGAYYNASGAPQWSAAGYDGKIRVPLNTTTAQGLEAVVAHEITHFVLHEIAGNHVPGWLDEGLAQIAEGRDERWAATELQRAGGTFPLSQLESSFTRITDPGQARIAYAQALVTTRRVVNRVGMGRMRGILDQLAAGRHISELVDVR